MPSTENALARCGLFLGTSIPIRVTSSLSKSDSLAFSPDFA